MFDLKLYISSFHPLKVAGRGSETQLEVSENSLIYQTYTLSAVDNLGWVYQIGEYC